MKFCHLQQMWMYLEKIMLSKISQTQKGRYSYDMTYIWNLKNETNVHSKTETEIQKTKLCRDAGLRSKNYCV